MAKSKSQSFLLLFFKKEVGVGEARGFDLKIDFRSLRGKHNL